MPQVFARRRERTVQPAAAGAIGHPGLAPTIT
jgi:hypothetical protein